MERICMFYPNVSQDAILKVEEVLKGRWVGQGKVVAEFEEAFAKKVNAPHAVAVNVSSAAIHLALELCDVKPGDEVITTPQTCTAANMPILQNYAKPVFTDINYLTSNINPEDIEHRITEKTKAIICAHWAGYPCDMDEIHAIAKKNDLPVIEDASDAFGATYKERPIGSISSLTAFSFQAVRQLTTGEGGMLTLKDKDRYDSAMRRRWYGIDRINRTPNAQGYHDFEVTETGYGYHMTNIQAAIGLSNLAHFKELNARRNEIAKRYREELRDIPKVALFENKSDRQSANELFTIHVEDRDHFYKVMQSQGIDTSIVHLRNDIYKVFGGLRTDLPELDKFTRTNISIPLHNQLTDAQVTRIITTIKNGW
ncbi:MAG: DegT/DnrJ/EryC1/StrS family aminotransferase [Nanoarchaeota archaeon]